MGWWSRLVDQINDADLSVQTMRDQGEPRRLNDADFDMFTQAAYQRRPPKTRDQVRERIRLKNPVRWHRLQSDLRWLRRQAAKEGLNPEDAPWLL